MDFLEDNKEYINKHIFSSMKNESLLNYNYQYFEHECKNESFGSNCFFKSTCDALSALDKFKDILKDNNNYGKFILDIINVSEIGGLTPIKNDYNSNPIYQEIDTYQSNKNIGCMASALTVNKNGIGRNIGGWGEVDQVLIYLFNALDQIKYSCMDYNLLEHHKLEIIKYIDNQTNIYEKFYRLKLNNNYFTYNKKMHFIFDKKINNEFYINAYKYNNNYFNECIVSEYNDFCCMYYEYENNNIKISPILNINFSNINLNEYNNFNLYLQNYISFKYDILYIRKILIIKLYNYGKNIDFKNFNKITYSPHIIDGDENKYKLKSVIYCKKDDQTGILRGGHFVCVKEREEYYYEISVMVENNKLYANYLFYEKIN